MWLGVYKRLCALEVNLSVVHVLQTAEECLAERLRGLPTVLTAANDVAQILLYFTTLVLQYPPYTCGMECNHNSSTPNQQVVMGACSVLYFSSEFK